MNNNKGYINWLEQEFLKLESTVGVLGVFYELLEQAKAMHKEEQKIAYESGFENSEYDQYEDCYELKPNFEDWYEETFGSK